MEHRGKFGHTLRQIQNISLMSRIDIFYTACRLETQTVAPTLPGFQVIKICIQYLVSHLQKPIFNTYNSYYGSNFIRLTWSGNQVEDYTTQNYLECHQNIYHAIIINRRRLVFGIFIVFLVLLYDGKYRFNQLWPLNPLMDKLYSCTNMSRKMRLSRDTWKP